MLLLLLLLVLLVLLVLLLSLLPLLLLLLITAALVEFDMLKLAALRFRGLAGSNRGTAGNSDTFPPAAYLCRYANLKSEGAEDKALQVVQPIAA